ncbi:MAG: hypothetical protein M1818_006208 [Claussenomyces sp. TS43310]|nr:MAG: hypothetical protein M1818_006208 [Claussenomyces sp. TS43310]
MVDASRKTAPIRTKNPPSPQYKDQYHSLLHDSESETHLETIHTSSKRRPWQSPSFCVPAIISFVIGMILVAGFSINLMQLRSILGQMQDQLSIHNDSAVPISSLSTPNTELSTSKPTGVEFGHCGRSIKEARALGCIFDPMSFAWQRPECYNTELIDDFLTGYDWHFFPNKEPNPSEELPREEWMRGDHLGVWGPWSWHMYHCSYAWRKFHVALSEGRPLDSDVLDPEHTTHCTTEVLLRDADPKLHAPCVEDPEGCNVTMIWTRFNKCGYF